MLIDSAGINMYPQTDKCNDDLYGRNLKERVAALIKIAHPESS